MDSIPNIGEVAAIGAAVVWSCSIVAFKYFGDGISSGRLNLMKNSIAGFLLLVTSFALSVNWPTESKVWLWMSISGVIGLAAGDTAGFFCMKVLGAQASAALQLLIPPFTVLMAIISIHETLSLTQQLGMAITILCIGGALYFRSSFPRWQGLDRKLMFKGILAGVFSAACQGVSIVSARHAMSVEVDPFAGTTIRLGASVVALVLVAQLTNLRRKRVVDMAGEVVQPLTFLKFSGIAAASFVGSYIGLTLLSISATHAKAGVTASLAATVPIWIIPVSYVFLGERASWRSVGCTVFALVGVFLIFI